MLELHNIVKTFGGFHAVDGCSLKVNKGEILGLVGPNGAGKTTLFNVIAGAFRATSGTIHFLGEDVTTLSTDALFHKGLVRTFQIPHEFHRLTALENLCFGTRMAEFHSGYMLYSRRLLGEVPFGALQDNFNFDAEMILLAWLRGYPCREIAIPTRYDATTSSLKPVPYGLQVLRMVCRHLGGHYRRLAGVPSLGAAAPEPLSPGQTTTPIHS